MSSVLVDKKPNNGYKMVFCLDVLRQNDVHGLLFHSTRTGGKDTGVISQCKNGEQGSCVISQCTNIRVGLRCYFIVHKHEGKGHVLFHSARTGGQGACVISQCTNRMVWVRKERTMYNVPHEVHLMNFCSMRVKLNV